MSVSGKHRFRLVSTRLRRSFFPRCATGECRNPIWIVLVMTADSQRYRRLPDYLTELDVVPRKIWDGGLNGIPAALEYVKAGKISGEKIVVKVA